MRFFFFACLVVFAAATANAQALVVNPYTQVKLQAGPDVAERRTLAVVMTPADGWHTYWKNPGGAGVESRLDWTLPAGAELLGETRYPVPSRFVVSGIMNYVYEGENALLVDVKNLPSDPAAPIALTIDYLVCDDEICVPETASLSTTLGEIGVDNATIARHESRQPVDDGLTGTFAIGEDAVRTAVDVPNGTGLTDAYFFPEPDGVIDYNQPQVASVDGNTVYLTATAGYNPDVADVRGILKLFYGENTAGSLVTLSEGDVRVAGAALSGAMSSGPNTGFSEGQANGVSALAAFGLALLGGIILNLMPCVFPILSLKTISLAKGGASPAAARQEASFYTVGVVLTVVALGSLLLVLRAGGASIGWAFQLQDPRVVGGLFLLVTAIALNLAGLYELPSVSLSGDGRAAAGGKSGSFWTGVLAAVVATPCTGPFMGAALGAALVLSGPAAIAIFAGLGLGLALPFLLIGFVPALRDRLPKPGPWMQTMRRVLSVPMFATALALAWVLG
ncbi:MAG: protein-disulfide reductase DsbD domain-containing protein, partial [Pacificimonas sp.]